MTADHDKPPAAPDKKPGWWRRWVIHPVVAQLKQGISPDKLGWTIGAGVTLGIFPILGTRAWLCLLAGWWFKLNQPVLHSFKSLVYPLHLALIIPFIQFGQRLYGKEPLRISLETIRGGLSEDAMAFWRDFGWAILRAASAWLLLAPVILIVLKLTVTPVLRKFGMKEGGGDEREDGERVGCAADLRASCWSDSRVGSFSGLRRLRDGSGVRCEDGKECGFHPAGLAETDEGACLPAGGQRAQAGGTAPARRRHHG